MTSLKVQCSVKTGQFENIKYRDVKNIDLPTLHLLVNNALLIFSESLDINTYFEQLASTIKDIYDTLAPVKIKRIIKKEYKLPFSDRVKGLKEKALFHCKRFKNTHISSHFDLE
jgi:hypothetical protein